MILAPLEMDLSFVLTCAAVVFLMQAGFCLLEGGLVRTKNSINVAVKNMLDFALTIVLFGTFGFALMFGASVSGFIGDPNTVDPFADERMIAFFLFQAMFCGTAATIVSGAVAERTKLWVYLALAMLVSGVVYPVVGHWVWGGALAGLSGKGWLAALGLVDWAGCLVVHATGGFAALAACQVIGPRRNVDSRAGASGYSLPLAILGCFLLWFGWWGFNAGSALAMDSTVPLVLLNTNLGACGGLLAAAAYSLVTNRRIEVTPLIIGSIAGLVSVTAACHVMSPISAIVAGVVGAILATWTQRYLSAHKIDDVVGAFPVHGVAGVWGAVAFALFAPVEILPTGDRMTQLSVQLLGALVVSGFSYGCVFALGKTLAAFTQLRVKAGEEVRGLNMVEHGATTEVVDLLDAMSSHRSEGEFSKKIQADVHTEYGQIASEYNRVLDRVQSEIVSHEETNEWLASERLRLQSVLQNVNVGIYQLDMNGKFVSANPTLLQTLGCHEISDLNDGNGKRTLPWHAAESERSLLFQHHFDRGTVLTDVESELEIPGAGSIWVVESLIPICDAGGKLVNWLGTMQDISERRQAMLAQVEVAEAKSEAKGAFLANMSHEIRTPLNGVIGMLDLLSTTKLDASADHYVSVARSSADSLLSLINDILDFSKIEAGRFELESIEFSIRDIIEGVAEQFAARAHQSNLELNCQIASEIPKSVIGDPERLRQVITNLLGNAIKFTDAGEINVRVTARGSLLRFSVQDTGIGMSEDVLSRLFDSFMQADVSTTRKYGGTGLGLAISSQLTEMMGGKIHVESVEGEGTEFSFELDLATGDTTNNASALEHIVDVMPGTRVLVIDDNATNCEILSAQLSEWQLDVSVCQDSTAATERLLVAERLGSPFELIVLDFCMPQMDGADVAREIQKHACLTAIPIIMLSSNHELMAPERLRELGINIAMTKPARRSRLMDAIMTSIHHGAVSQEANYEEPVAVTNAPIAAEPSGNVELSQGSDSVRPAVLVAEDNQVNQMVVQRMLSTIGYDCDVAEDGLKALELFKARAYEIVLMDGHMPNMDGVSATREIRKWELESGRQETPVVAVTANVQSGMREECIEAGMNDYLAKPITSSKLREVLQCHAPLPAAPQVDETERDVNRVSDGQSREPVSCDFGDDDGDECVVVASGNVPYPPIPEVAEMPPSGELEPENVDELFAPELLYEQCEGDTEFAKQILTIMRDTLPRRIAEIDQAFCAKDLARVRSIAHQVKGAAGDSSLCGIYDSAAALEENVLNDRGADVAQSLSELKSRVGATLDLLDELLA